MNNLFFIEQSFFSGEFSFAKTFSRKRMSLIAVISSASLLLSGCAGSNAITGESFPEFTTIHMETTTQQPSTVQLAEATTDKEETSAETTPETTEAETTHAESKVDKLLASMTTYEKVCQMFIVTQEQITGVGQVTQSGEMTKNAIGKYPVGGIIYFSPNIQNTAQVKSMISNIQSYSTIPLFIAVDEEGGQISRIANCASMGTTSFPSMSSITDKDSAYNVGLTIGKEIKEFGFNLDFAPVADVNSNPDNPVIGERAFSSNPNTVAEMVSSCVKGFNKSGMLCTLKHFPGHGDTQTDSHLDVARTDKTLQELEECELIPFVSGIEAGASFVMVGHINAPELSGENIPAEFSKYIVTDLLRSKLNFNGLIITDSMQMKAIADLYSSSEAAVNVVKAGVDVILTPVNLEEAINGIITAVESGDISSDRIDESVRRILQVKYDAGILE